MKQVAITLICGFICVGIGAFNIWLGVLALPILYSFAQSLRQ